MFDTYRRECPRCHALLRGQRPYCRACHKLLPRKLSRVRRIVDGTVLTLAIGATGVGILAPDFVRGIAGLGGPAVVAAVSAPAWHFGGRPPAARSWAYRIEPSLSSACEATYQRYSEKRFVVASLSQFLGAVAREQGQPLTPESAKLTEEEKKEAFALLTEEGSFLERCLRASYVTIEPCEPFKGDLAGKAAADCMVPAVTQALVSAPFQWCAVDAQSPRLRSACAMAAQQARVAANLR